MSRALPRPGEHLPAAGATLFAAFHLDKASGLAGRPDLSAGIVDFYRPSVGVFLKASASSGRAKLSASS
jgi:hypothetical protein